VHPNDRAPEDRATAPSEPRLQPALERDEPGHVACRDGGRGSEDAPMAQDISSRLWPATHSCFTSALLPEWLGRRKAPAINLL
jgi:hypothetical protein